MEDYRELEENSPQRAGKLRRAGKFLLRLAIVCLCLGIGFVCYAIATAPPLDREDVSPDGYRTTVLDDQGEQQLTLMGEASNRVYITLDQIPKTLQQAVVAIEDERFYQHHGVDLRGIARAVYRDVTSGSLAEGASTITQQLIKNNVLSGWTEERTALEKVKRKLQEQYLALRLERETSKDWILENYLNTINLGGGAWGVETAAQRYFGKSVSELTLSESAVLAGITKSPSGYNPLKNPEANARRRTLVLDKMLELGNITQAEYDEAMADDVYARIEANSTGVEAEILSYFEDAMVYEIVEDLTEQLGYTEEAAWQLLYRGGLTVESTQNTALQTICEEEINRDSWYSSDAQSSIVMMDPATGQVKAIVGGRGEKNASLTLNRAVSSVRQPGSTVKIVGEYAAALDAGEVTLATVYDDAPYTYSNGSAVRNASGTYQGRTTVRKAIADSVNIVALKCFQQTGMETVWDTLQRFGFAHLSDADKVEALALGGTNGGVTNLELTAAYSAIAGGGTYLEPIYYTRILDREGNVLLENTQHRETAVSPETAALLTAAMQDVLTEGTGTAAYFSGMPLAGKSGTTTDLRDLWFVGYSPYYACGVWGGFDDNAQQSGGTYVKKLWGAVMQRAHQGLRYRCFEGLQELQECTVCSKCGLLAVDGLCEDTVQGDMTQREYFVPGTEPVETCNCHVKVELCEASGLPAGRYCPHSGVSRAVYLKEGTAGTADESAVAPEAADDGTCTMHSDLWDLFLPGKGFWGDWDDWDDRIRWR